MMGDLPKEKNNSLIVMGDIPRKNDGLIMMGDLPRKNNGLIVMGDLSKENKWWKMVSLWWVTYPEGR